MLTSVLMKEEHLLKESKRIELKVSSPEATLVQTLRGPFS